MKIGRECSTKKLRGTGISGGKYSKVKQTVAPDDLTRDTRKKGGKSEIRKVKKIRGAQCKNREVVNNVPCV